MKLHAEDAEKKKFVLRKSQEECDGIRRIANNYVEW